MQNGREICRSDNVELHRETARGGGGGGGGAGSANSGGRNLKRYPPMVENRYRCPLARYKSKRLSLLCQNITFETPEEAMYAPSDTRYIPTDGN
jgi:hypothetical protein